MATVFETDYLVVGAGAMSLAFVDTILAETDADVIIVDRYDMPGGHWRVAYDYVRLHQPSDYYGVNSRPLGSGVIETHGYNAGLLELARLNELRDYFEKVMLEQFIPSGRVRYFPKAEYLGDGRVQRLLSGEVFEIVARRRIVDATHMNVQVPAVTPPPFRISGGARVVTPNELTELSVGAARYAVLGGGKTGIDTVLWLLERGAAPSAITWVVPRDAWLFNREICQPGPDFITVSDQYAEAFYAAWMNSSSTEELYDRLAACEYLFRLSNECRPSAFRSATVTRTEVASLRRVEDVVRLGRVLATEPTRLLLEDGVREFDEPALFINCTANGLARLDSVPVFAPGHITLQSVVQSQQVYGASFIAHVEAAYGGDEVKNRLTTPVPHPYDEIDLVRDSVTQFRSELLWAQDPELVQWREEARLAGVSTRVGTPLPPAGPDRDAALAKTCETLIAMIEQGEKLLHDFDARNHQERTS